MSRNSVSVPGGGAGDLTSQDLQQLAGVYIVDTGTANTYACAPTPAWTSYVDGATVFMRATNANTGPSTVNISSLGAKNIRKGNNLALDSGDIPDNYHAILQYQSAGDYLQLLNPYSTAGSTVWTEIESISFSANASKTSTATIAPGKFYRVSLNLTQNTSNGYIYVRFNGDSGANYSYGMSSVNAGGSSENAGGTSQNEIRIGSLYNTVAGYPHCGEFSFRADQADGTRVFLEAIYSTYRSYPGYSDLFIVYRSGGMYDGASNLSSITIQTSAGTLTGTASIQELKAISSGGGSSAAPRLGFSNLEVICNPGYSGIDGYTELLLHCNGDDASTTFTDSAKSLTVTAYGNAQLDTAQMKFGTASGLFDGTGDYLSCAASTSWDFGSNDFTMDCWIKLNAYPSNQNWLMFFSCGITWGNSYYFGLLNDNGTYQLGFEVYFNSLSTISIRKTVTISTGIWYHVAVVRNGNDFKIFLDGNQQGSTITDTDVVNSNSGTFYIGQYVDSTHGYNGWLDEVRISKGIARWTTNFTPPAAAYGAGAINTASFTADAIILYDSTADDTLEFRDVNESVNIGTAGVSGLDTGTEASNTWYFLWAISNGTLINGLLSTSATAPTMPSGYTYKKLVGAIRNDSSGSFIPFYQTGNLVRLRSLASSYGYSVLSGGSSTGYASLDCSSFVPSIADTVNFAFQISTGGANGKCYIREFGDYTTEYLVGEATSSFVFATDLMFGVDTSQRFEYKLSGSGSINAGILGYWLTI